MEGRDDVARLLIKRRKRFDGPVRAGITWGGERHLMANNNCRTFIPGRWLAHLPGIFNELWRLRTDNQKQ